MSCCLGPRDALRITEAETGNLVGLDPWKIGKSGIRDEAVKRRIWPQWGGGDGGCGEGGPPSVVKGPLAAVLRTGRTGEEATGLLRGLPLEPGVLVRLRPGGRSGIP